MTESIQVVKNDALGKEVWRWDGEIIRRFQGGIFLQAFFNYDDFTRFGITYKRGDRFREIYFSDKWFNIFEMHDRDDGVLKAWYCNFSRPAVFTEEMIRYDDLALDALVMPDFQIRMLDEEEYEALNLDEADKKKVSAAVDEIRALFKRRDVNILDILAR